MAWNYDLTQGHEYRAEVYFQPVEEVIEDVKRTLQAVRDERELEENKELEFDERQERLTEAAAEAEDGRAKIRAIWNFTEDRINELSLESQDLTRTAESIAKSNSTLLRWLQHVKKEILCSDSEQFSREIKPYLDTTQATLADGKDIGVWPLISKANVYLRHPLLKCGIALVDLPGIGDSNRSRSRVAREYYARLDFTLAVAHIARATDYACTESVINGWLKLRCQIDGRATLGLVLSKMEDSKADDYFRRSKDVQQTVLVKSLRQEVAEWDVAAEKADY